MTALTDDALIQVSRWQSAGERAPLACDSRFVVCPDCEGYGVYVVSHGRWPDGSDNNEELSCPTCDGEGVVEQAVSPVDLDDDIEDRAPLDHIAVGGDLADAGNTIVAAGLCVMGGYVTEHILREARIAIAKADRLLRQIEERLS